MAIETIHLAVAVAAGGFCAVALIIDATASIRATWRLRHMDDAELARYRGNAAYEMRLARHLFDLGNEYVPAFRAAERKLRAARRESDRRARK
jgi:hypothetical protein